MHLYHINYIYKLYTHKKDRIAALLQCLIQKSMCSLCLSSKTSKQINKQKCCNPVTANVVGQTTQSKCFPMQGVCAKGKKKCAHILLKNKKLIRNPSYVQMIIYFFKIELLTETYEDIFVHLVKTSDSLLVRCGPFVLFWTFG